MEQCSLYTYIHKNIQALQTSQCLAIFSTNSDFYIGALKNYFGDYITVLISVFVVFCGLLFEFGMSLCQPHTNCHVLFTCVTLPPTWL